MAEVNHDSKIEELESAHGDVIAFVDNGELFAFKAPSQDVFEEYQIQIADNDARKKPAAFRVLCRKSCVHGKDQLEDLFKRRPAYPVRIADQLSKLAGSELEFISKKG